MILKQDRDLKIVDEDNDNSNARKNTRSVPLLSQYTSEKRVNEMEMFRLNVCLDVVCILFVLRRQRW